MTTAAGPAPSRRNHESALAQAIAEAVSASSRRRVHLPELLEAAASVDRSAASAVGWRGRVLAALEDLRGVGVIEWPKASFDRSATPPLPMWVARPVEPRRPTPVQRAPVWRAELAWAADPGSDLSASEVNLLAAVNDWLARGDRRLVPVRERSLEVFGDEKQLETLLLGRLFGPGRLTLDLLWAESCWPEVVESVAGPGADWLIVENYTTYVSVSRAAQRVGYPDRVIWGSGNQIGTRLASLALAGRRPSRAWYFGDVDTGGFKVARTAVTRAGELGLGGLSPAWGLYRLALEHGTPRATDTARAGSRAQAWIRSWLGDELGPVCADIAGSGQRVVQEHAGTAALSGIDMRELLGAEEDQPACARQKRDGACPPAATGKARPRLSTAVPQRAQDE